MIGKIGIGIVGIVIFIFIIRYIRLKNSYGGEDVSFAKRVWDACCFRKVK